MPTSGRDSERLARIMKEVGCCNSIPGFREQAVR